MKKLVKLTLAVIVLGTAIGLTTTLLNPLAAWARAEGTWFYNTFTLVSTQTMSIAGTETHTGTESHSGTETHSGVVTFSGGQALSILTTTQLVLRTDPIGTEFTVKWAAETNRYGKCISTAAATASYVWTSTRTTTNIGLACP